MILKLIIDSSASGNQLSSRNISHQYLEKKKLELWQKSFLGVSSRVIASHHQKIPYNQIQKWLLRITKNKTNATDNAQKVIW